jgi:arsenate reductase (thioredoxin)
MSPTKRVLFVCIENSGRSQMAEAFARLRSAEVIEAYSAGSHPSGKINPAAIAVMREVGYDMSGHRSKSLADIPAGRYEYVITMGCGDECPFIPAIHHEDWQIPDPKGLPIEEVRKIRDQIGERVKQLTKNIRQDDAHEY